MLIALIQEEHRAEVLRLRRKRKRGERRVGI